MKTEYKEELKKSRAFLTLWATQSFSSLGSAMTGFALVIWTYQREGSALSTSLLTICSYAPYVLLSIFAGTLSDRWDKKRTMLVSDGFAALCTVCALVLLSSGRLAVWHLYVINTLNGLMNTVQQPASDVAVSLLTPKKYYQKVSGLRSFSNSLVTMLTPILATALLSLTSVEAVLLFDLFTFAVAFLALLLFIRIPSVTDGEHNAEPILRAAKAGLLYLKNNRGILDLILLLAAINFTASMYNAALPAMLLSRAGGGDVALGLVNTATGVTTMLGSLLVTLLPAPKSRVKVILNALLFSMGTENFILAFGQTMPVWCLGAVLGWIFIPLMSANMDVLMRTGIPIEMQGRVYSARNTLQFFTIPLGYFCGGILIDKVLEPLMARQSAQSLLSTLFGTGKGSGAAFLFFVIGILGVLTCLPFRASTHLKRLEDDADREILQQPNT